MDDERRDDPAHADRSDAEELLLTLGDQGLREHAFELLPDAALIVDHHGIVADLNRRAVDLLGRSPDERVEVDQVVVAEDGSPLSEAERRPLRVGVHRVDGTTVRAIARGTRLAIGADPSWMLVLTDQSEPFGHLDVVELEGDRRRTLELEGVARADADELRQRVAQLQAITDAALVHLSLDQLFDALLGRLRDLLGAEAAAVLLLDPEQRVLRVTATSGLHREQEDRLDVPLGSGVAGRIATARRPVIIGDLRRVRSVNPFLHKTLRSLVGVPIVHRGEVTGVVHVGSLRPRHFTEEDIALLEIVAARLAPAIENAQLHEFERSARAAAEEDARRLGLLRDIAEALGTIRDVRSMAQTVLEQLAGTLGTASSAVALIGEDGRSLEILASLGLDEATVERWRRIPRDADIPIARCLLERRPLLIGTRQDRDTRFPELASLPSAGASWAALPLVVDGRDLGALGVSFPEPRSFTDGEAELFSAIAHQCAQAIDRASRYEAERRTAERAEATSVRLALLQSLTARYSRALTPREVAADTVTEIARSLGADSAAFYVLDEDGMLVLEGSHGYPDASLAAWQRFPADVPTPASDALRRGDLIVAGSSVELVDRYPALASSVTGAPAGQTVATPIVVDERAVGAVALTFSEARTLEDDDLALLRALGRHAGQALERARLYETERRARRDAERAHERTERLQALAAELAEADTEEAVARVLSEHVLAAVGGNASVVVRKRDDGEVHIVASRGYVREVIERDRVMRIDDASPLNDAMRTRVSVWVGSKAEFIERYPLLLDDWDRLGHESSFAGLPLKVGDRVLGAVGVRVAEPDAFTDDDKEYLRAIARQAAQAIEQTSLHAAEAAAREELERGERRYRSLIETTSSIHWTVDPAGAFVEEQPSWAAYTGQTWDEYRGFAWVDGLHPDDRDPLVASWRSSRDAGTLYENETRLFHAPSGEHRWVISRAAPVRDDGGHIVEWVGTVTDIHDVREEAARREQREALARVELEEASERLAYLAAASSVLATSLDVDELLQRLADLAVPRLADWCAVDLLEDDGSIRLAAVAHVDPARVQLARDLRRRYPPDPDEETGMPAVLRTGRSMIMPEIPAALLEQAKARNPELAELVDELQFRSVMVVPITTSDRTVGAITFVWAESGRSYDQDDLALAEDLARRAAVSIENAWLFAIERTVRREEARARERLEVVAEAGGAMMRTLNPREIAETLTVATARRLSDYSVAYLVDRDRRVEDFVVAHRDPTLTPIARRAASLRLPTPDDEPSAIGHVLRTGEPMLLRELPPTALDHHAPGEQRSLAERFSPVSELAVPIRGRGGLVGVLAIFRSQGREPFDEDDLELTLDLGRRAGIMLENARLYAEREEIAETLQRSLLPPDLPSIPGLDVGARYLPAAEGLTVGGDFYDVFELDFDHWGAVIGDVVGKGAAAAAMMGLARYTVRTAALSEGRPSALLRTLNDAIVRQASETMFCTACFARVRRNEDGARVTLSLGGHPAPMLVRSAGVVEEIGDPGTLLGVFEDPTLSDRVVDLGPGDALVFYTDGVTDERRGTVEFGTERLRRTLADLAGRDAQAIADGVVDAVDRFRSGAAHDDIALLVIAVRDGARA